MERPRAASCPSCAGWRLSRRSLLRRGGSVVPIPAAAFDGLAARERQGSLTRRDLLAGGLGLLALCGVAACGASAAAPPATTQGVLEAAAAANAEAPEAPILVSLYLDGGNDGLNTLVPLADRRYAKLRPRIAVPAEETIPLAGVPEFGWHPSLPGLARLYDEGKVAVLPSVDFANPDLSHFNSAEYWRKGIVGHVEEPTGWLGRALDLTGSPDNPLQGVSVQWGLDPVLVTAKAPVATVYDPSAFGFWIEGVGDEQTALALYDELVRPKARFEALQAARSVYGQALAVRSRLAPLAAEAVDGRAGYPETYLGNALRSLARMLSAGFGTRVAAVSHDGGFDTHEAQPAHHARILRELDRALVAWQADLEVRGLADRVLTLVWSEFGRRPQDNSSDGTDHGAGGLLLVVGNRANGGIRSEFPGLARLDPLENLLVTTEFRAVYATLLESWLGIDAEAVLPGALPARLDLVQAE